MKICKCLNLTNSNEWISLARSVLVNDQDYDDGGCLSRRDDVELDGTSHLLVIHITACVNKCICIGLYCTMPYDINL